VPWSTYPRNETLVHQQAWESCTKRENNKRSPCFLVHFPLINTAVCLIDGTSLEPRAIRLPAALTAYEHLGVQLCLFTLGSYSQV